MKTHCGYFQQIHIIIICLLFCSSSVQSQTVSLIGKVVDASSHQPVANAVVVALELGERKNTTSDGHFQFERVRPGRYTISVHHIAYAVAEKSVLLKEEAADSIVIELQPALLESDEVVVRSTRTSASSEEVSYPFNVETSDQIVQQPSVTVPDVLKESPGVALVRDGSWETDISIRGMARSNIVTMVDNTRIETATDIAGALSMFDVHDLDRVEVVKSPGSVLFGTGAFGGVLHMITKRSSFTDEPKMNAETTNDVSSVDGKVSQYAALESSSDEYAMRFSGSYRHAGNTMTPAGEIPNSQYHDFNLNGSVEIKTFGSQSLYLSYQRSQAEDTGIPGGSQLSATAAARYTLAKRELFGLEYNIPNIGEDVPLVTFRLSQQDIDRAVEVIQTPTLTLTPEATHSTTSGQAEAKLTLPANELFTFGTEVWQRDLDSKRERINSATATIIGDRPVPLSHFFSAGIYGQDECTLIPERLTLTLGARYDWIHVSNDETMNPLYTISGGVLQNNPSGQSILWNPMSVRDKSWSANGGLSYAMTSEFELTSLVSSAFRAPSLEERYEYINLGSIIRVGNPNLKSEKSTCENVGFRIHTSGLQVQSDAFFNHLTDLVAFVPGTFEGANAFVEQNIGEAKLYGYEISVEQRLTEWEGLKYYIAYVRGEDTFDHTNLAQIAPLNGRFESTTIVRSVGTVNMAATAYTEQKNLGAGEIRTAGYVIIDATLTSVPIVIDNVSLTFRTGVQNILNKLYQDHLSTLRGLIVYEPGRNFFLSTTIAI
jgi:hemoglobin/transferrin/lactoferrin receptor protein